MPEARYFLPDHPELKGEYSRDDLRLLVKGGKLSRSDMVIDDETGLAHLLGALLVSPYYLSPHSGGRAASDEDEEEEIQAPQKTSFAATTPPVSASVPEGEIEEDSFEEPIEPVNGGHVEFRAASPLRQRESPGPEDEDDYVEDPDEEHDDDLEEETGYEDDEEDDDDPGHRHSEDSAPKRESVFQAALPQEEELLFHGHPSWLSYPKALLGFVTFAGAAILCVRMGYGLEWCVTAAALAMLSLAFVALDRMATEYFITTRRVEVESGLLGRSTREIRIADIRAIDVTQRGLGALFGIGTLDFSTSAGGEADVCFVNVYRPHRLKQKVRDLQA